MAGTGAAQRAGAPGTVLSPTGAICAAATTSLPEVAGGTRNWDYRYAWVRDASFTIQALWVAACPDEANGFFEYMARSAAGSVHRGADLQIMFGVGGERDLTERVIPIWPGGATRSPFAWATAPGTSASSTSTANCSAPSIASPTTFRQRSRELGLWPVRTRGGPRRTWFRPHGVSLSSWPTLPPVAGSKRPGDLGGPGRAPPILVLQADVLGGATGGWPSRQPRRRRLKPRPWRQAQDQSP